MGKTNKADYRETDPANVSYLDKVQQVEAETGEGPEGEVMNVPVATGDSTDQPENQVSVDESAADLLEPTEIEPQQVAEVKVVFVPFEDFDARINQTDFTFQKDVPVKVTRDEANMYLEAKKGYVRQ